MQSESSTSSNASPLGTALVIGGCGFIGYHLVGQLIADPDFDRVCVYDINVWRNRHDDDNHDDKSLIYISGHINAEERLYYLLKEVKPSVIFHTASPFASLPARKHHEFTSTNIEGTKTVIKVAQESEFVKALIYTSTVDIYADSPHYNVDETHPLWSPDDTSNEYNRTKAIGDKLVLGANGPSLHTASVRLGHAYGMRQSQGLTEVLDTSSGTQRLIQIGNGENLTEVVSGENSALGHIAVAKALLDSSRGRGKVDGEAFNISDGSPVPFWHHVRVIWEVARGEEAVKKRLILPAWLMASVVVLAEWFFWVFTLNKTKPPTVLSRLALDYCTKTHTYSIEKARERLGFKPVVDHDAVLARAAQWMIEQRAEKSKTA